MRVSKLLIFIHSGFLDDACGCMKSCASLKTEYILYHGQKNENMTVSILKDIFFLCPMTVHALSGQAQITKMLALVHRQESTCVIILSYVEVCCLLSELECTHTLLYAIMYKNIHMQIGQLMKNEDE